MVPIGLFCARLSLRTQHLIIIRLRKPNICQSSIVSEPKVSYKKCPRVKEFLKMGVHVKFGGWGNTAAFA